MNITKVLVRLCGCAGKSVPLLLACNKISFSCVKSQVVNVQKLTQSQVVNVQKPTLCLIMGIFACFLPYSDILFFNYLLRIQSVSNRFWA